MYDKELHRKIFPGLVKGLGLEEYFKRATGIDDLLESWSLLRGKDLRSEIKRYMSRCRIRNFSVEDVLDSIESWERLMKSGVSPLFAFRRVSSCNKYEYAGNAEVIRFLSLVKKFGFAKEFLEELDRSNEVNLEIPLNLSQDFWDKNKDEIEDFFSFFFFKYQLYIFSKFYYPNNYIYIPVTSCIFSLSDMFSLYFSDAFQNAFKDVEDRQLKFSLLGAIIWQLVESGNYDSKTFSFNFSEDQIKKAIEQVKRGLDAMKSKRILFKKGMYTLLEESLSDFVNVKKYEELLAPSRVFNNIYQIKDVKGPLWLHIVLHGQERRLYYYMSYGYDSKKRDEEFYLTDGNWEISVGEVVSLLKRYAKNNNGDLSQVVIIAGNCNSGFWVRVLKRLAEDGTLKGFPIVISGSLPVSAQMGVLKDAYQKRFSAELKYGPTLLDMAVQRFIEEMQKKGKTSATLYELLEYLADKKLPLFPMIYSVEKKNGGKGIDLVILSVIPPLFPWGAVRENEVKNDNDKDLFRDFLDNIKESLEHGDGRRSLFVDWLLENEDELIEALDVSDDVGNGKQGSIDDLEKVIGRIENIKKPLEENEKEKMIQQVASIFRKDPDRFVLIVQNKVFGEGFEGEEGPEEKGGIEFSEVVRLRN